MHIILCTNLVSKIKSAKLSLVSFIFPIILAFNIKIKKNEKPPGLIFL